MQIYEKQLDFHLHEKSAVAIGKFDGIHLGHRKLIEKIIEQKKNGYKSVVFTFDPAPIEFFTGKVQKDLTTKEEKRRMFQEMGVDILIEFPLNECTAATPPEKFVSDILCGQMKTAYIVAGADISFGDQGKGDAKLLKDMAAGNYQIEIIDKVMLKDQEISSTLTRKFVEAGEMEACEECLGSPYSVSGIVEHGKKLGRTLGMPTLNLYPVERKLLPPNGVYYSIVKWEGQLYKGISNVGYKPTATDDHILGVETYLYDFDKDLYGKDIQVFLLSYKRPEMKFANVQELKCQMERDIEAGRFYHHL